MRKNIKFSTITTSISVAVAILAILLIPALCKTAREEALAMRANKLSYTGDAEEVLNRLNASEILALFESTKPTLEYTCPYETSKCINTAEFANGDDIAETWDVYLYKYDGLIGTWIVNQNGQSIDFYGNAYIETGKTSVKIGQYYWKTETTYVSEPDTYLNLRKGGYMVVT